MITAFDIRSKLNNAATLAPAFALYVEDVELRRDLTQWITRIEFEHAVGMADMMKIRATNPYLDAAPSSASPDLTSHKAFAPGNEADLFLGYDGNPDNFIGRAIFARHLPNFRAAGQPELTVTGYAKSHLMMGLSGELIGTNTTRPKPEEEPEEDLDEEDQKGKVWQGWSHWMIVQELAEKWKMRLDGQTGSFGSRLENNPEQGLIQPKDMSDYEFLKGLADLNDYEFWVDYDYSHKQWTMHWRQANDQQTHICHFHYGAPEADLIQFQAEYGLSGTINELVALGWDDETQTWLNVLRVEGVDGEDPRFRTGAGLRNNARRDAQHNQGFDDDDDYEDDLAGGGDEEWLTENLSSMTKFRLAAGGAAIDVVVRPFESMEDLAVFATRWFRARRDSFLIGRGRLVGHPQIRARQVHRISGLGNRLSGDYYFTQVRHVYDLTGRGELPYVTEFVAHKVIRGDEGQ